MRIKCCVYEFKSNYDSTEERYSAFTLAREEKLRQECVRKLLNANLSPTKYNCVCEKHFTVEEGSRYHVIGNKHLLLGFFLQSWKLHYEITQ